MAARKSKETLAFEKKYRDALAVAEYHVGQLRVALRKGDKQMEQRHLRIAVDTVRTLTNMLRVAPDDAKLPPIPRNLLP